LIEVYIPYQRQSLPAFQNLIYFVLAFLFLALGYFIFRQFRNYSLPNKLIVAFVMILVFIAGVQIFFSSQATRQNIETNAEQRLTNSYATYQTRIETQSLEAESLAISVADRPDVQALFLSGDREKLYNLLLPMFAQWKDRQVVHLYIENPDGTVFLRVHDPANFGDAITYRGTTSTALVGKRVTSGVEIGPSRLGVQGVAPMYSPEGQFLGLAEVGMDFDQHFIEELKRSTGSDITMWVSYEAAKAPKLQPADGAPAAPIAELFYYASTNPESLPISPDVYRSVFETGVPAFQIVNQNTPTPSVVYITPLLGYNSKVFGLLQISESYAGQIETQNTALLSTLGVTAVLTILGLILIWLFTARFVIQPLNLLSQFAARQTAGETGARVAVGSGDEFQQLAETFNALASSVEQERQTLEQRVADRTQELETARQRNERRARQFEAVAQVARAITSTQDADKLLTHITQLVSQQFGFYHVGIFFLDDQREYAVLAAANSAGGEKMIKKKHRLKVGQVGIVGYAAGSGNARIALDTGLDAVYFDNPDLPDTHSEIALPLKSSGRVIGVLDVQSTEPSAFTTEDLTSLSVLADQVSIAIENTRQFEATQKSLEQTEATYRQYVRHQWARLTREESLAGYRYISGSSSRLETPMDLGDVHAVVAEGKIYQGEGGKSKGAAELAVPVKLRGEVIGVLSISTAGKTRWTDDDIDIVEAVAERLALSFENARLFQATTNRAERERVISEIASKISGNLRMDSLLRTTAQELSQAMNGSEVLIQLQTAKQDGGPQ
jgi:GAF domain-containing protein/HAMP domain-containing protein